MNKAMLGGFTPHETVIAPYIKSMISKYVLGNANVLYLDDYVECVKEVGRKLWSFIIIKQIFTA